MINWNQHSKDWHQGWKDAMQDIDLHMSKEEKASKSEEWRAGLKYAIQNPLPFGIIEMYLSTDS